MTLDHGIRLRVSPDVFKSLLTTYAADDSACTVKSHLGDKVGGGAGDCGSTIGQIVARTPSRFRVHGVSIFDKWAEARRREAAILDDLVTVRSLRRVTRSLDIIAWCDRKVKALERAHELALEQTLGWETHQLFAPALAWAAGDLERRLMAVSDREILVWAALLEARAS